VTHAAQLYLLEPPAAAGAHWFPYAGTRPIADLRAGALRLRERWSTALATPVTGIIGAAVGPSFADVDALTLLPTDLARGPGWVARSDAAPALATITPEADAVRLMIGNETVAWRLDSDAVWTGPHEHGIAQAIDGLALRGAYDLVTALERLLAADVAQLSTATRHHAPPGAIVLGAEEQVYCRSLQVEPGVVFDVRHGPILIEPEGEIRHGTRLEGPLYVASGSRLLGGDIRGSSIGPKCVVRGEVSVTCFTGYANKGHEGFIGHSVLGHWVNLGAGTTTSNLKNTYGQIRLDPPTGRLETGRQFLGTLFGDHAKTAIGTMCGTGTLIGAGAHMFGGAPPKCLRPMAWGSDAAALLDRAGFLAIAERVLPRRQISWTDAHAATLGALYDRCTSG
jgi:UDP-N-acetylglucosamine diphosphorylase/glucosamine-1-phosphate N-acetyltransferase